MKKTISLRKRNEFSSVFNSGKSYADKFLVMYVLKNQEKMNRLGISVSKKVGNSVVRHRITRLVRENYRLLEENIETGYNIVIIARVRSNDCDFYDIKKSLTYLIKMHKIVVK